MKNKIILSCLVAIGLSGCTAEFLEITPETSLSSVTFFKTEADFTQAVNACYVPLRTIYNDRSYLLAEMHSDNTYYYRNTAFGATEQQEDLADFSIDNVPRQMILTRKKSNQRQNDLQHGKLNWEVSLTAYLACSVLTMLPKLQKVQNKQPSFSFMLVLLVHQNSWEEKELIHYQ